MMSQTQIFEWVKDGNLEGLQNYFSVMLDGQLARIRKVFNLRDNLKRGIIHWAAYLGQDELLKWWFSDYIDILSLNIEDNQNYTPLELAAVRGYSNEYNGEQQLRTVQIILDYRAKIKITKDKPTPLHWAYYYCNLPLIEFLILKDFELIYALDDQGNYPIDYLFFENKNEFFKQNIIQVFSMTIQLYVKTTNKNKKFQKKQETNKRTNPYFENHNSTQWFQNEDYQNILNQVENEPQNGYQPESYNIRINSQKLVMKYFKAYKTDNLSQGKRKITCTQIQNVVISSRERQ